MEILAVFGAIGMVTNIVIGIGIVAMIIACTLDRHFREEAKWIVFAIFLAALVALNWSYFTDWSGRWQDITQKQVWAYIAYYLLIGLGYSILEFSLDVRRSARYWAARWNGYKVDKFKEVRKELRPRADKSVTTEIDAPTQQEFERDVTDKVVRSFLNDAERTSFWSKRIIVVQAVTENVAYSKDNPEMTRTIATGIEPKVDRAQLAGSIGCWTIWWPFYAISLIIGDLLTEVFRVVADILANMSGRFVRLAFKDVFKF